MNKQLKRLGLLVTAAMIGAAGHVFAADILNVSVNGSRYMEDSGITRLAVGNPDIADIRLLSNNDYLVVGKKAGSTSLLVWSNNGRQEYNVYVSGDDEGTEKAIQKAIGYPGVKVQMMNGKLLLRGKVKNQYEHDSAVKVAQLYLGSGGGAASSASANGEGQGAVTDSNIIDLLDMTNPSQVRLEAQIIEINTSAERNLGIQYWSPTIGSSTGSGSDTGNDDLTRGSSGLFYVGENFKNSRGSFGWLGSHISNMNASLQALVTEGKARILSRPSITTMSGQKANILIGGRIPIPTSAGDGQIAIDWRDYGIKLNIEPVVDAENKITSKVHAEVSTLDYGHSVTENDFSIPAIASREADAVINVRSGMTMAIGGLLNSQDGKTVTKIPLLGDIPIIGQFFRHTQKTRDNRELLILITPTLVSDDTPVAMSQRMKGSYEDNERYLRNAERVNVNTPVKPGTEKQETDIFGGKPGDDDGDTVILEEKPKKQGPSHILRTTDEKGETVYVPMTEEDYAREKNNLQVVGVEKPPVPEGAEKVPVVKREKVEHPVDTSAVDKEKTDIRDRVRAVMDGYAK
ncbi:type II and III secretion system protein family protein [Dialister succinatiphilus]|uniref:type II and III secretion system protein family protein n=1 Tax=Dialister succinatiphilus TaxID=487173 RepID=UPI002357ABC4|nr:pilus assembly protein N-terminal domain-containing protein [Dialister succinatiphilus]MCI6031075.1 pilus assembly protein N-terminal domain-containing protein [Dialister succinatiphilus]